METGECGQYLCRNRLRFRFLWGTRNHLRSRQVEEKSQEANKQTPWQMSSKRLNYLWLLTERLNWPVIPSK